MNIPTVDEIQKFSRLEDIHGASQSTGRSYVCPYTIITELTPSETELWVEAMVTEGILSKDDDMILKVALTDEGKNLIRDGISKRQNPSVFRKVTRERLLEWVHERSSGESDYVEVNMDTQESWFYGREISLSDLETAALYLAHHGLASVKGSEEEPPLLVALTEQGRECVASSGGDAKECLTTVSYEDEQYPSHVSI